MTTVRRCLALLLAVLAVPALSGCGSEQPEVEAGEQETRPAQVAETEGIYLDIDDMKYQVEGSRELNPGIVSDSNYLSGLSADDRELGGEQEWFAVFIRIENHTERPIPNVENFQIVDTQENVYRPMPLGPENVWAYRPAAVEPEGIYPTLDSPAGERAPNGALLLFKIDQFSLDNRPLELVFEGRSGERAIVNLDV
jgi:hypothetical protein